MPSVYEPELMFSDTDPTASVSAFVDIAKTGAQLFGAAKMGNAQLGATVGNALSNYAVPPLAIANTIVGLANKLVDGPAASRIAATVSDTIANSLGGDAGDFLGGVFAASFSLVDGALNLVGNIADKWLGFDASRWFGDTDDLRCDRPSVEVEGRAYDGRGYDTFWLQRGILQPYIWSACDNSHSDIRFTHNIERHLPGVGFPHWGRDYTRGLLESKRYADGSYGWNGYASARANSRGDDWKNRYYWNNAYSTTDIYLKHLAAMRRVRVPVDGYIYETSGSYINTTGLPVLRVRDAVEKHADELTYQDISAMIALDALPAWLAIELANGSLTPKGTPTAADLSHTTIIGAPRTYTGATGPASAPSALMPTQVDRQIEANVPAVEGRTSTASGATGLALAAITLLAIGARK